MKTRLIYSAILFLLISHALRAQHSLEEANNAYYNLRVPEAKKAYEDVWASTDKEKDKTEAGKQLVKISWKFYKDYDRAKAYADTLMLTIPHNFDVPYQIAGISIEAGKYDDARKSLQESLNRADNGYRIKKAQVRLARCVLLKAQNELSGHRPIQTGEIQDAIDNLQEYFVREPENLEIARLCLGLALLLENDEMVLDAYRTYFRVPENETPAGSLAKAEVLIRNGLQSEKEKATLVRGLALSRFYDFAVMTMDQYDLDRNQTDDLADICNYEHFLKETVASVFDYFRQKALGTASDEAYTKNFYTRCIDFWGDLSWEEGVPVFYEEGFEEELFKRFGTKMNTGEGGMDIGFFAGHSVFHERREIEQYGRQGSITYNSLDYIAGNIYPHWYFGFFGVGGWNANKDEIMSIRTVSFNGNSPLKAFNRLMDEKERANWLAEIAKKSARDDSIARIRPYELMEGLPERIKFQNYGRLIDSLKPMQDNDKDLKIHFLSYVDDILLESVVFNHEGRHALDSYVDYPVNKEIFSWEEREFRANLSGIEFSPDPKMTIGEGLFVPQDPAHENGNRRIIKGLVEWMDLHRDEIEGLDPERPLLPQLDLLTNAQIVRATRSIDPLYAEYIGSKN